MRTDRGIVADVRTLDYAPGLRVGHPRPSLRRSAWGVRRIARAAKAIARAGGGSWLSVLALACGGSAPGDGGREAPLAPAAEPQAAETPSVSVPAMDEVIHAARLREHVQWLADDRRRGRGTPSPELDDAAEYLRDKLKSAGLVAPEGAAEYFQRFECGGPRHPGPASNVLALLPGRDAALAAETVIVSAHYDHLGERGGGDGDRIYNGANDNASGTAAMLVIAEALASDPPRRSVLFIGFCGEERGLLGSRHYAKFPLRPLANVVAHANLEMLGHPPREGPPIAWVTGMGRSDFGDWLNAANEGAGLRFVDGSEIGPKEGAAFHRSDNFPLAEAGVVAHTISSGAIGADYHTVGDEAEGLDYEGMAVIVRGIARGVYDLAECEGRPIETP